MADRIELTKNAKKAIHRAAVLAGEAGCDKTEAVHLLGALFSAAECSAYISARKMCDVAAVCERIRRKNAGVAKTRVPDDRMSAEVKSVIEYASVCSLRAGLRAADTRSILYALLCSENREVMRLVSESGANPKRLKDALYRAFTGSAYGEGEPSLKQHRLRVAPKYTVDLTELAREGRIDDAVGRDSEIFEIMSVLCRRLKNNVCLVGEAGVGKTALAEGVAYRLVRGEVPDELRGKRLLSLEMSAVVAGTKYRGDFEERLRGILSEVESANDSIVFIDELHTALGAGAADGAIDASGILKPLLARSGLKVIGATTAEEYSRIIQKDGAFERRFSVVEVREPSGEQLARIISEHRNRLQLHHGAFITDTACREAVRLSERYIHDRFLPDKAVDLLDETCARKRLMLNGKTTAVIDANDLQRTVELKTGIPVLPTGLVAGLSERLKSRVVGQDSAVDKLCGALVRREAGLTDTGRPSGCFLLCGPTGVGKTELCRAVGESLFHDKRAFIRVDMSEYRDPSAIARLIGAAPGYIGHERGGLLTEDVRRRPYSVVVFDEIEKACPEVMNLLLQIAEEGELTDSRGRKASFCNAVVMATTNLCAEDIACGRTTAGFGTRMDSGDFLTEKLCRGMSSELVNRFDEIIFFEPFNVDSARLLASKLLATLRKRLFSEKGIVLVVDERVSEIIAERSDFARFGGRAVKRSVTRFIENEISMQICSGTLKRGHRVCAAVHGKDIAVKVLGVHGRDFFDITDDARRSFTAMPRTAVNK